MCDLLRERRGDEEVKVFFIIRSHIGDRVLGNAPPLDNPCGKVCVLFRGDSNAVRGSDRVRKPLQQLGQELGEFQPVELLASYERGNLLVPHTDQDQDTVQPCRGSVRSL